jgi:GntR family transcriptional regulator, transcriptional repressor for pyruvate dehydrogenase complex
MAEAAQPELEIIRRQKVYEAVAEQIQRLMIAKMQPGDKLPSERELAETLKVSRGSIRDAIRSLELMGLVEPRQGAGTIVRETEVDSMKPFADALKQRQDTVTELLEFREMLEPPVAARAAKNVRDLEQILLMRRILDRQEEKLKAGEPAIAEDNEFHYMIALISGNNVVLKVMDLVMDLLRDTRQRALQVPGRPEKSLAGHHRILEAIRHRDPEAAEGAMRRHIREVQKIVLKNFERGEDASAQS